MSTAPRGRLLLATFTSGVVMNVLDAVVNGVFFLKDFEANSTRLGLNPRAAQTPIGIVTWVGMDFVFGFVLAWLYGVLRAQYGSGMPSSLRAAAVLYVPTTSIIAGFCILGMITPPLFGIMAISGAVVVGAGAIVAGRVY